VERALVPHFGETVSPVARIWMYTVARRMVGYCLTTTAYPSGAIRTAKGVKDIVNS
jgi:hypothetical protein